MGDDAGSEAERLDDLVVEYVERLVAGEAVDPREVIRDHPDLAEEILENLKNYTELLTEPSADPILGTFGDYTVRREIGRGGMGVVYDAWQRSMDRRVALKVLPPSVAADPRACVRFVREAQAAGKLSHPSVVRVHGLGIEKKTPYYAMEFVEGETLATVLARSREASSEAETPFGRREDLRFYPNAAEAFADVADGLQHAHAKGVVHRDIKPSNLIFDRGAPQSEAGGERAGAGRLRILDFGLARIEGQESLTASGDYVGTPLYMSPEQAQARKLPVDHRTDVYSLGATLYELLTARPPFSGKDHRDTISQIVERDPARPRKLNPRVPKDLETIVLVCLQKDPGDRYGTAEALAQDLQRFVRGDPIERRPPGRWEILSRRARRHRWRILAATAAAVLLFAFGALSLWWEGKRRESLRLAYEAQVTEAAREFYQGQFILLEQHRDLLSNQWLYRADKFRRGRAAVRDMEENLSELSEAVPDRPEAPYYLSILYRILGMEDAASREADRALERDPSFVPAEVQAAELRGECRALGDREIDDLLARHAPRGDDDWQGAWLLAYRARRDRDWAGAAEAYGRLIGRRSKKPDPYVGYGVQALLGRGLACLELKRYRDAVLDFQAASALWPHLPEARLLLAKAHYEDGDRERAGRELQSLWDGVAGEDGSTRNRTALWIAHLSRAEGNLAEAETWEARIGEPDALAARCVDLYYSLRYEDCIECTRTVLRESPDDVVMLLALASSELELQWWRCGPEWDERRGELLLLAQKVAGIYPNDIAVQSVLARALQVNGREEEALEAARETLRMELRLGDVPYLGAFTIARVFRWQDRPAEAEAVLREAFQHSPGAPFFLHDFVSALVATRDPKKYEEALGVYETMTRGGAGYSFVYSGLAGLLNELGLPEEAEEAARTALERPPENTPAYGNLALAIWRQGRTLEALATVEEGIQTFPDIPAIRVAQSRILEGEGLVEEALEDLGLALALDPGCAPAHEALRESLARMPAPDRSPALARILEILEEGSPRLRHWTSASERIAGTLGALRKALGRPAAGR